LTLMNSEFMTRQAGRLAEKLSKECGDDRRRLVEEGTRTVFGRRPTAKEIEHAEAFLNGNDFASLCLLWFNTNEYLYVD
jgi:hypothetical protein